MAFPAFFRPEALDDLATARAWYEERLTGLGGDFMTAVEQALERIARAPASFQRVRGPIRRAITHQFPYGVFFVESEHRVTVLAVLHHARHPRHWQSRSR